MMDIQIRDKKAWKLTAAGLRQQRKTACHWQKEPRDGSGQTLF